MIERLNMEEKYSSLESAIHMARYNILKPICKNKTVLDIACGEGYGSYLIKSWGAKQVDAFDIDLETINKAQERYHIKNLNYQVCNAEELEQATDKKYDLIVSFETIEHLKNPIKFLEAIKSVSKKDAIIIISCPNDYMYYPKEDDKNPFHIKKYSLADFITLVESVLGKADDIKFGQFANGFINTNNNEQNKVGGNQNEIVEDNNIYTNILKPDMIINEHTANYFLAIWNTKLEKSATIFPYPFSDQINTRNLLSENKEKILSLTKKHEKKEIILDSVISENEYLKRNIADLQLIIEEQNYKLNQLNQLLYIKVRRLGGKILRKIGARK